MSSSIDGSSIASYRIDFAIRVQRFFDTVALACTSNVHRVHCSPAGSLFRANSARWPSHLSQTSSKVFSFSFRADRDRKAQNGRTRVSGAKKSSQVFSPRGFVEWRATSRLWVFAPRSSDRTACSFAYANHRASSRAEGRRNAPDSQLTIMHDTPPLPSPRPRTSKSI